MEAEESFFGQKMEVDFLLDLCAVLLAQHLVLSVSLKLLLQIAIRDQHALLPSGLRPK